MKKVHESCVDDVAGRDRPPVVWKRRVEQYMIERQGKEKRILEVANRA